jgi:hypothetical protein
MRYALHNGHKGETKQFQFGDGARLKMVYQSAIKEAPEGKELVEIKFEGTAIWRRGSWSRGPAFKRAFPGRYS